MHYITFLFQSGLSAFCFVPFAVVCLLSALYVGLVLPETKGKSLSAISREFHKLNYKSQDGKPGSQNQAEYQLGETYLPATVQTDLERYINIYFLKFFLRQSKLYFDVKQCDFFLVFRFINVLYLCKNYTSQNVAKCLSSAN